MEYVIWASLVLVVLLFIYLLWLLFKGDKTNV